MFLVPLSHNQRHVNPAFRGVYDDLHTLECVLVIVECVFTRAVEAVIEHFASSEDATVDGLYKVRAS